MDASTRTVKGMYEAYPYPRYGVPSFGSLNHDLEEVLAAAGRVPRLAGLRVLDAGCGTGDKTTGCALMFPEVAIDAFDLSSASLGLARQLAETQGCRNVRFAEGDIMVPPDGGPGYDVVIAMGVVMLLSDPVAGLQNLGRRLKPGGLVSLYLYSTEGRQHARQIQAAVNLLCPDRAALESRLDTARTLVGELAATAHHGPFLSRAGYHRAHHRGADQGSKDARLFDQLAHVHERTYTLDECFTLLDAAGLELVAMLEEEAWQLEGVLSDSQLLAAARRLPALDRYRLIESLKGAQHEHRLVACRKGERGADDARRKLSPGDIPHVRRAVSLTSPRPLHAHLEHFETPVAGFLNKATRYKLSRDTLALLKRCDGRHSLAVVAQVLAAEAGARVAVEAVAAAAADLAAKRIIDLYPPGTP